MDDHIWRSGSICGLVGGIIFGAMLQMMMPTTIGRAIPALWGLSGMGAGWVVHLVNSIIFGVVYTAIVQWKPVTEYAAAAKTAWVTGGVYGILLWIIAVGLVMPIWLSAVGFPMAPPLPNLSMKSLIGHLVYGIILGVLYPYLK